jgi:hypothetical protein
MDETKTIEAAIDFTAAAWLEWSATAVVPSNVNVRDRLALFAPSFKEQLLARFSTLRSADNQVLLLVLAEAVARSGTDPRLQIEASLGITLPPVS